VLPNLAAQPLYAPIAGLAAELLSPDGLPGIDRLNAYGRAAGLVCGGRPLRFVAPGGGALAYEERAYRQGEVETRPGNWHDFFNAVAWLSFPRTKDVFNRRHHRARSAQVAPRQRGALRDALTQFDECGAVVVSDDRTLWDDLCGHRWRRLFWERRAEVAARLRVVVFGHASYDLLRAPHPGLCAKAVFLRCPGAWLDMPMSSLLGRLDERLARHFSDADDLAPRHFQPLPLLGVPGAAPGNAAPDYYDDIRQFRPRRAAGGRKEADRAVIVAVRP